MLQHQIQNTSENTRERKADDYESVKVPANCSTTNERRHEHVIEPIEPHANAQKLSEKMHIKSPYACQQGITLPARKHNRLRTHPGVSREKDILILEDTPKTVKFKEKHRKVATVPTKCSPMFRKLEDIKHTADKAIRVSIDSLFIKQRKYFMQYGLFSTIIPLAIATKTC